MMQGLALAAVLTLGQAEQVAGGPVVLEQDLERVREPPCFAASQSG